MGRGNPVTATLDALSGFKVRGSLPADLIPTDRIIQRWYVSVTGFLPSERWDEARKAKLSPLNDTLSIIVDQIIARAPERRNEIIWAWYGTPAPTRIIAEELGVSSSMLKLELHSTLQYMLLKFKTNGHPELLRLLLVHAREALQEPGR